MRKYYLVIGTILKNESHSIKEWLEHYIYRGIQHFFLINDASTDNTLEILKPYVDSGKVTIFENNDHYYIGRQKNAYNRFFLPIFKVSTWWLIVDADEYVWSPDHIQLLDVLNMCYKYGQVQINNTVFGSNGHIEQPKSLVQSMTKRTSEYPSANRGNYKYFINSDFEVTSLNIHHATFLNKEHEINNFLLVHDPWFIMNHYCCQSLEFWKNVKCMRGDADDYKNRDLEMFDYFDINEVDDTRLYEQNKYLIEKL